MSPVPAPRPRNLSDQEFEAMSKTLRSEPSSVLTV